MSSGSCRFGKGIVPAPVLAFGGLAVVDYFLYIDETGNFDLNTNQPGATEYFGFGSALYPAAHAEANLDGLLLRAELEHQGTSLPKGFHAKNDKWPVKTAMFRLIADQKPRIDATLLFKPNIPSSIRELEWQGIYQAALSQHLARVCKSAFKPDDRVYLVIASLGTNKRATITRRVVTEVIGGLPNQITLCIWDAESCWGLQVADYVTWAIQRQLSRGNFGMYTTLISPLVYSLELPYGQEPDSPALT